MDGSKLYDLQINNLSKTFFLNQNPVEVLKNIQLDVVSGEFLSIVGASGCGKSTLLRLIVGLDENYTGSLTISDNNDNTPKKVSLIFQEHRLFPWFTVTENVAFGLGSNYKGNKDKIVKEHIELVGLGEFTHCYPRQLSGGMRQRIAIARALVSKPDILLLDEPFGALDAMTRIRMQQELLGIWKRGQTTMIIVTHDIDEAVYLGDRVAVMDSSPGSFKKIVDVTLSRPRDRNSYDFASIKKEIYREFFNEEEMPYDFTI
ncbi:MAG TPA: ABC transporter ATP-binding protein [Methylomusa anaerophila]|uniref:Aliphatic sulfonates import ATP-binding protein SsuB n=1 Tax=Methylomusa anaerophila TaxID=1930071 RepID=A0A348AG25_9FIRM|nr:ABC transporter ATP-binding protein [Methylomusa anaerophila]BBB90023.1 aliphatic sulfonates import ATP-binding protein SsuB [Methylomusa anaerophila]HML88248.1 ABC transporter ATP-binding protein [Methylomusa anaerophila]